MPCVCWLVICDALYVLVVIYDALYVLVSDM